DAGVAAPSPARARPRAVLDGEQLPPQPARAPELPRVGRARLGGAPHAGPGPDLGVVAGARAAQPRARRVGGERATAARLDGGTGGRLGDRRVRGYVVAG